MALPHVNIVADKSDKFNLLAAKLHSEADLMKLQDVTLSSTILYSVIQSIICLHMPYSPPKNNKFQYHHLCSSPFHLALLHNYHFRRGGILHNQNAHHNHPPHQHIGNPGCTLTIWYCRNPIDTDGCQNYILDLCSLSHYCMV